MLDVKVLGLLFVLGSRNPSSAELRVDTVHANPNNARTLVRLIRPSRLSIGVRLQLRFGCCRKFNFVPSRAFKACSLRWALSIFTRAVMSS